MLLLTLATSVAATLCLGVPTTENGWRLSPLKCLGKWA